MKDIVKSKKPKQRRRKKKMQWEVRESKEGALPWRVCLCGTDGKVVYAASKTESSAQIAVKRLNNSEDYVD